MIFISYSWHNIEIVRKFNDQLQLHGYDTWIDYRNLDLNHDIFVQLKQAVANSDAVLFFESKHSMKSAWVRFERQIAHIYAKPCLSLPVSTLLTPNNTLNPWT